MIIKTAELYGTALDWAVARVTGVELFTCGAGTLRSSDRAMPWKPSASWAQGGPLVDRPGMKIERAWYPHKNGCFYIAQITSPDQFGACFGAFYGKTLLIAAMRAIVASDLGDTVDVPKELCE